MQPPHPERQVLDNQSNIMVVFKNQKTAVVIDAVIATSGRKKKLLHNAEVPGPEGGTREDMESKANEGRSMQ